MYKSAQHHALITGLLMFFLGIAMVGVTPSVHAAALNMECVGVESDGFKPAITYTSGSTVVTVSDTYECYPSLGQAEGLTGGSYNVVVPVTLSCTDVLQHIPTPFSVTYNWNDCEQSTVQYTSATIVLGTTDASIITYEGTVQSGLGSGSSVTRVLTLDDTHALTGNCGSPSGLVSEAGQATLTFGLGL